MSSNHRLADFDPDAQPENERTITITHVDDAYDIYGGRADRGAHMGSTTPPNRGWLGNPYRLATHDSREEVIDLYETAFLDRLKDDRGFANAVLSLPGNVVACHCRDRTEDAPACHLDVVRDALLDGRVFAIADWHDIPMAEWKHEAACDPEVLL